MALAWLVRGWGDPLAFIVDHRLRPESAREALETASRLAALGIESRILTLEGLLPGPALAARARAARYAALTEAARAAGLSDLLLGHHGGDQAETFLIREAAASGPAGMACMAAIVETPGLRLVRPLLGSLPGALRDVLRAQGIGWVEDPSNDNPAASRTRVRRLLSPAGEGGVAALLSRVQAAGVARRAFEQARARRLAERASIFPLGYALLTPGAVACDVLAALIRGVSGADYPERGAALARLAAGPLIGTLGGVRFMPAGRHGAGTLVVREEAAMQGPVAARSGCVWDRRFRLACELRLPADAEIGALGDDAAMFRKHVRLASAILRTLPTLRQAGRLLAVPHLGYFREWTNPSLRLSFCPQLPVSGAPFEVFAQGAEAGDAQMARAHHVLFNTAAPCRDEMGQTAGES
jgi:tRNA(Ile)-lysidine synthase